MPSRDKTNYIAGVFQCTLRFTIIIWSYIDSSDNNYVDRRQAMPLIKTQGKKLDPHGRMRKNPLSYAALHEIKPSSVVGMTSSYYYRIVASVSGIRSCATETTAHSEVTFLQRAPHSAGASRGTSRACRLRGDDKINLPLDPTSFPYFRKKDRGRLFEGRLRVFTKISQSLILK